VVGDMLVKECQDFIYTFCKQMLSHLLGHRICFIWWKWALMRILSLLPGGQCAKRSVGNTHKYQERGQLPARRPFVRKDDLLHLRSDYQRMFTFLLGI
jgi:hypothetical protein